MSAFLAAFKEGTAIKLMSRSSDILFEGAKEDVPDKYNGTYVIPGSVMGESCVAVISIDHDNN